MAGDNWRTWNRLLKIQILFCFSSIPYTSFTTAREHKSVRNRTYLVCLSLMRPYAISDFLKKGSLLPCQFHKRIFWDWYINGVAWRSDRTIIHTINQKWIRSVIGCTTGSDMLKIAGMSGPSVILHPYPKDLFRILFRIYIEVGIFINLHSKFSFDLSKFDSKQQVKLSQNQISRGPWLSR